LTFNNLLNAGMKHTGVFYKILQQWGHNKKKPNKQTRTKQNKE
jgi:hypothetical protein